MGGELVTACVFCLLCHAHCSAHGDSGGGGSGGAVEPDVKATRYDDGGGGSRGRGIRDSESDYTHLLFERYGDGETMTKVGFQNLIESLGIKLNLGKNSSRDCPVVSRSQLTKHDYTEICPQIVHSLLEPKCTSRRQEGSGHDHNHNHHMGHDDKSEEPTSTVAVWVYASISVVLISLCGLLAVAVIPLMQMSLYHGLLQFLVALAVGTLCGDALLHLLPHAMMSVEGGDQHETNLWRGFVASISVVFFYFTEKCLSLVTEWKKKYQRKGQSSTGKRVRVMREEDLGPGSGSSGHHGSRRRRKGGDEEIGNEETEGNGKGSRVGEKLCKHKYSSYPYCYGEIANSTDGHQVSGELEINNINKIRDENGTQKLEIEGDPQKEEVPSSEKQLLEAENQNDYTTIILREHETRHHGHAHTHGHVHSAPASLGSVAWMVVMGDGIHNLTDGLAIGAAFAANIGGGISTAVAVFCHELPHEIGDFAVLLKAGMSARQAVFYNLLSSLLCFFGMSVGIVLGHNDHLKLWVFSAAAGMFLYIALVDMIPELTSSHSREGGSVCQCLLQLFGLISGIGIMLIIAIYEHDLMTSFQNKF